MEFVPAVAMLALVWKIVDFLKFVTNKDVNGAVTQLTVWGAGVAALFLYAQTGWADGINIGDQTLATLNAASLIAAGLGIGSAAAVGFDFKKARDNTDSAVTPPLAPPTEPHGD